jgi:hypothetical protein
MLMYKIALFIFLYSKRTDTILLQIVQWTSEQMDK